MLDGNKEDYQFRSLKVKWSNYLACYSQWDFSHARACFLSTGVTFAASNMRKAVIKSEM